MAGQDCVNCTGCVNCDDCVNCVNCVNCDDCRDCVDCVNCDGCVGLRGASGADGEVAAPAAPTPSAPAPQVPPAEDIDPANAKSRGLTWVLDGDLDRVKQDAEIPDPSPPEPTRPPTEAPADKPGGTICVACAECNNWLFHGIRRETGHSWDGTSGETFELMSEVNYTQEPAVKIQLMQGEASMANIKCNACNAKIGAVFATSPTPGQAGSVLVKLCAVSFDGVTESQRHEDEMKKRLEKAAAVDPYDPCFGKLSADYGVRLGPFVPNSSDMSLELEDGEKAVCYYVCPPRMDLETGYSKDGRLVYDRWEMSYKGKQATNIRHSGARTATLEKGDVAGQAIRCVGPGTVQIKMAWRSRDRLVEERTSGTSYLEPEPLFQHPDDADHTNPGPAGRINDPRFVEWLKLGKLEEMLPGEDRVHYARRLRTHINSTIVYRWPTTESMAARATPGGIVALGATDCGGGTYLFTCAMQRQNIPCRASLAVMHVYAEMYIDGCGWVGFDTTPGIPTDFSDPTGTCGHTISVGCAPTLDLSSFGGGPRQFFLQQMPGTIGWPKNAWKGGRNGS